MNGRQHEVAIAFDAAGVAPVQSFNGAEAQRAETRVGIEQGALASGCGIDQDDAAGLGRAFARAEQVCARRPASHQRIRRCEDAPRRRLTPRPAIQSRHAPAPAFAAQKEKVGAHPPEIADRRAGGGHAGDRRLAGVGDVKIGDAPILPGLARRRPCYRPVCAAIEQDRMLRPSVTGAGGEDRGFARLGRPGGAGGEIVGQEDRRHRPACEGAGLGDRGEAIVEQEARSSLALDRGCCGPNAGAHSQDQMRFVDPSEGLHVIVELDHDLVAAAVRADYLHAGMLVDPLRIGDPPPARRPDRRDDCRRSGRED